MSDQGLSERDICTKFITPAIERAGWDLQVQIREEVGLTAGKVLVHGTPVFETGEAVADDGDDDEEEEQE